jgi:hypothetical protein
MLTYHLDHICTCTAQIQGPPEMIGPVAEGIRAGETWPP